MTPVVLKVISQALNSSSRIFLRSCFRAPWAQRCGWSRVFSSVSSASVLVVLYRIRRICFSFWSFCMFRWFRFSHFVSLFWVLVHTCTDCVSYFQTKAIKPITLKIHHHHSYSHFKLNNLLSEDQCTGDKSSSDSHSEKQTKMFSIQFCCD